MTHLRYVVLHHTGITQPHYDLMFETSPGAALDTFRLPNWPIQEEVVAVRLGEHRREYLDHEGPVSGGRGRVKRVAGGTCAVTMSAEDRRELVLDGSTQLGFHRPAGGDGWRVRRKT